MSRAAAPIVLVLAAAQPACATNYVFDSKRSLVRFAYVMGFMKQQGRFRRVEGTIEYDEAAPAQSRVIAKVATASLTTGQPLVDEQLKGEDFFNVKAAPSLTFKSRSVRSTGTGTAQIRGDLTIKGITKPVTFAVTLRDAGGQSSGSATKAKKFVATTRIKRSAFNMTSYQFVVSDDVDIEIDAIAQPSK